MDVSPLFGVVVTHTHIYTNTFMHIIYTADGMVIPLLYRSYLTVSCRIEKRLALYMRRVQ